MANDQMTDGNIVSPNVPKMSTLRTVKSRMLAKQRVDKNPIQSLYKLKYSGNYSDRIHDIGLDRFFVHYWSSTQIKIYNNYIKALGNQSQISIDATGGVVKKFIRPNGEWSILLYDIFFHN